MDVLAMGGEVRGVNEDVVEVDHDAHVQHVGEDAVDKALERGGVLVRPKGITNHLKEP